MNRSLIAAATAAFMAGPLAAAGVAASLDGTLDPTLDLTCKEARAMTEKTGDPAYVEEFCEPTASPSPSAKTVTDSTKTVTDTTKAVTSTVEKTTSGGGGSETNPPVDDEVTSPTTSPNKSAGNDPRPISQDSAKRQRANRMSAASQQPAGPLGYDINGPIPPGLRSHSQLTLQPFAAPVVSGGFVYELPQIAEQLFGDTGVAGAEDPLVAAGAAASTEASPYSSTGFTSTPADASGWLAATATGLIMLVGAGHALAGGRTPKRERA